MTPEEINALPYRECVGIVLVNAAGGIFVGQRVDRDKAAWQMPQGGIDPGESVEDAALRELWEETGVTANLVDIEAATDDWLTYDLPYEIVPNIWKGRYRGQAQKWVLMRFQGQDSDINIATEHPEFSEWKWTDKDALTTEIVPFKRDVYEQVVAAFSAHL